MKPKPRVKANTEISRQRRWQLRQRKLGKCRSCRGRAYGAAYCKKCRIKNKKAYRRKAPVSRFRCSWCNERGHNIRTCEKALHATKEAKRVETLAAEGKARDRTAENARKREIRKLQSPGWPPPPPPKPKPREFKGWPRLKCKPKRDDA